MTGQGISTMAMPRSLVVTYTSPAGREVELAGRDSDEGFSAEGASGSLISSGGVNMPETLKSIAE